MSKPIIVGYDPQTFDRAPVNFAVAAARFTGAPLVIASVCAGSVVRDGSAAGRLDEDLAADASGALDEVGRELDAEGIAVEFRQIDNTSAARALHEAAEAQDAGLLVVGSTNRGAIGRVLPGSTAERLMHGAPCPIAIVPHEWEAGGGLNTIGVAYVDTDEGREALRGAHALARRTGAKLRVLTAVKAGLSAYGATEATTPVQARQGDHRRRGRAADPGGERSAATDRGARGRRAGRDRRIRRGPGRRPDPRLGEPRPDRLRLARLRAAARRAAGRRLTPLGRRCAVPGDRAATRRGGLARGAHGRDPGV